MTRLEFAKLIFSRVAALSRFHHGKERKQGENYVALSVEMVEILLNLAHKGRPVHLKDLRSRVGEEMSVSSLIVQRLAQRGLVESQGFYISLTSKGNEFVNQILK